MKVLHTVGLAARTTVHGFRSSFRTWASEQTDAVHAVMELCLSPHRGGLPSKGRTRVVTFLRSAVRLWSSGALSVRPLWTRRPQLTHSKKRMAASHPVSS